MKCTIKCESKGTASYLRITLVPSKGNWKYGTPLGILECYWDDKPMEVDDLVAQLRKAANELESYPK